MSEDEKNYSRLKLLGKDFKCTVCQSELFIAKRVQLTFDEPNAYNFGRKKELSNCLICKDCGYMHFFLPSLVHNKLDEKQNNQ